MAYLSLFFFAFSVFVFPIHADSIQNVTIRAERVSPLGIGNEMTSTVIITQEEIRAKQYKTVAQALQQVPGVDVSATAPGQTVSVFIRGQKSEQTLVLVDGIEYNDPSDPGRGADLSHLTLDNVERIEVIRGAQSVLYPGVGSVIQIITKAGGPPKVTAGLEAGSHHTARADISTSGTTASDLRYSVGAGIFSTDGISAKAGGAERDGARTSTFSGKFSKTFKDRTSADLVLRYFDGKSDLDAVPEDTSNYRASQQNWLGRIQGTTRYGIWEPVVGFSVRTLDRTSLNFGSTPNTRFITTGSTAKVDWANRFFLSEQHIVTAALETERQHGKMESNFGGPVSSVDKSIWQSAALAQYDYVADSGPFVTAGARVDYHTTFYSYPTVRVAPGWKIKETGSTLRAAAGTGFKAPSIYQLYGEFGNASLKPEKAVLLDIGIEQSVIPNVMGVIVTVFYNHLTDMVDYDFATNKYTNVGKAVAKGIELSQETKLTDWVKVSNHYTYLETRDELTGLVLLRRPRHRMASAVIVAWETWEGSLTHQWVGSRADVDATSFARKDMAAYHLFNAAVAWQVLQGTRLHLRLENLFNTQYQAVDGYGTPGLSLYVGARQEL